MIGNELPLKASCPSHQPNENRVIFSNRQDYLLRYLVCDIAPIIGKVGHAMGTVFLLCFDVATEFLLTHELQAMGKYGPIRAESLCLNYTTNPHAARVQLLHLLKACNILVGCWEHVLPILEAQDGPLLSFDMFDVLAIWDAQLMVGNDMYASFAKKYIHEEAENPPKVLSFMTCYLDAAEIFTTVELIKNHTLCKGNLVYLIESIEDVSCRVDHMVELTEEQKDLYDKIKEHMQQYESQLQEISSAAGTELFSPYAMGTQEYNEWLDVVHLFCYRQAKENPAGSDEVDKALALLRRLKQYNTSLKMVEETSCYHTIQLLNAAHQEDFTLLGLGKEQGTVAADLARFSLFHTDPKPRSGEEIYSQTLEDFEAFKSALPDALKEASEGISDPTWALELIGEISCSITPKASALLKRVQAIYKEAMRGKKTQALVICYCKNSMDYIMDKVKSLNIHCVQGYYLMDLPDVSFEADPIRTHRRALRNQMERTMKAKTYPIVLTTRFTTIAIPNIRDWEWTEVLHHDADIYSVVSNKLSEGWCPQIQHHYFMTESSEGAYQYNCQKNNLVRLEEHLPQIDKVGITWSIRDRYSMVNRAMATETATAVSPGFGGMSIKPCYSVPVLQPNVPGSSPALAPIMHISASAPDLMLNFQSRSFTLGSLPEQTLGRPLFDSMMRIDSTGELARTESDSSKGMVPQNAEEKQQCGTLTAPRSAQLQVAIEQLKQQLTPTQLEVLQQIQHLLDAQSATPTQPSTPTPMTSVPGPHSVAIEPLEPMVKLDVFAKSFDSSSSSFPTISNPGINRDPPPLLLNGTAILPMPGAINAAPPPGIPSPSMQPIAPQSFGNVPGLQQSPCHRPMLPMQYRGRQTSEDLRLMVMPPVPSFVGNGVLGRGLGQGHGPLHMQTSLPMGRGAHQTSANPRKHAKTFNQKVDRAQQQLLQAGEAEKLNSRGPPPQPWPLAMLAEQRNWNEEDAKQIWNHNHQKLFAKTPPTYYFGERHHDGNVLFTAETELFCRVPHEPEDFDGESVHLYGRGEGTTKKEAQKKAAISVLKQLERAGILHIPNHYAEGSPDSERRSEGAADNPAEARKVTETRCLLDEISQQLWGAKVLITDCSRDRMRPTGQEFQCLLRAQGCPLQPSFVPGIGSTRKAAELDAMQKFLSIVRSAFPEAVNAAPSG